MNIAKRADEFLDALRKEGFNTMRPSEITKESCWHHQYAIFVLDWNYPYIDDDNDYVRFNAERFKYDFEKHIHASFPNCEINVSYGGKEYEIMGPHYDEFWEEHRQRMSELEETRMSGSANHWLYNHMASADKQMVERRQSL